MRHFLIAMLTSLVSLSAQNLGAPLTVPVVVDVGVTAQLHENGTLFTAMADDGSLIATVAIDVPDGPSVLHTRWTDAQGVVHEVVTEFPSTNPSTHQISQTIGSHNKIVAALKSIHPAVPPNQQGGMFVMMHHSRYSSPTDRVAA